LQAYDTAAAIVTESITLIRTINSLCSQALEKARFRRAVQQVLKKEMAQYVIISLFASLPPIFVFGSMALVCVSVLLTD
jgi:hypothetical protein